MEKQILLSSKLLMTETKGVGRHAERLEDIGRFFALRYWVFICLSFARVPQSDRRFSAHHTRGLRGPQRVNPTAFGDAPECVRHVWFGVKTKEKREREREIEMKEHKGALLLAGWAERLNGGENERIDIFFPLVSVSPAHFVFVRPV